MWVSNGQARKLVYDSTWGGVVTKWAWDANDIRVDYGNAIYNDHGLQYGYLVFAAAVVGLLDPGWLSKRENRDWVNLLIRDYANPVTDQYFPFSRAFDWYHGHSWATGLDAFVDGKSLESTSEDAHSLYAIKLWGHVIGDQAMIARATLQLAVLKRSLQNYFLMESGNRNQPIRFIANKAVGIVRVLIWSIISHADLIISYLRTKSTIPHGLARSMSIFMAYICFHCAQSPHSQELESLSVKNGVNSSTTTCSRINLGLGY
jgi:endo-1,3(4)-beta-glucanase